MAVKGFENRGGEAEIGKAIGGRHECPFSNGSPLGAACSARGGKE